MKMIIPMAGKGTRLRPHTHTTPKPLLMVGGKIMLEEILDTLVATADHQIENVSFILGDFNKEVQTSLNQLLGKYKMSTAFFVQDPPLGTGHAIHQAKDNLAGEVLVAYADTIFNADLSGLSDLDADGVIWVKEVENPKQYGVVVEENGFITRFVEKPQEPVSNKAIIGVYYFKQAERLKEELDILIRDKKTVKGEYQLTDALEALVAKGFRFKARTVDYWLDCGNMQSLIDTNQFLLNLGRHETSGALIENSVILPPVYLAPGSIIRNSVIGPFVSVGGNSVLDKCVIENSIVNASSDLKLVQAKESLIGSFVQVHGNFRKLNLGDHTVTTTLI
ncbi:MAG: NTP transferase domain-containing protein [Bacteroidetes bacterium]|nr:NTP transferase domain-containing protein [Bacteroidota bacterium]